MPQSVCIRHSHGKIILLSAWRTRSFSCSLFFLYSLIKWRVKFKMTHITVSDILSDEKTVDEWKEEEEELDCWPLESISCDRALSQRYVPGSLKQSSSRWHEWLPSLHSSISVQEPSKLLYPTSHSQVYPGAVLMHLPSMHKSSCSEHSSISTHNLNELSLKPLLHWQVFMPLAFNSSVPFSPQKDLMHSLSWQMYPSWHSWMWEHSCRFSIWTHLKDRDIFKHWDPMEQSESWKHFSSEMFSWGMQINAPWVLWQSRPGRHLSPSAHSSISTHSSVWPHAERKPGPHS